MADVETVGTKLARKIGSRKETVTPGPMGPVSVLMARQIPGAMGRLRSCFSRLQGLDPAEDGRMARKQPAILEILKQKVLRGLA